MTNESPTAEKVIWEGAAMEGCSRRPREEVDTGRSGSLCVMFVSDLWSKGEMRSEVACIGSILAKFGFPKRYWELQKKSVCSLWSLGQETGSREKQLAWFIPKKFRVGQEKMAKI